MTLTHLKGICSSLVKVHLIFQGFAISFLEFNALFHLLQVEKKKKLTMKIVLFYGVSILM